MNGGAKESMPSLNADGAGGGSKVEKRSAPRVVVDLPVKIVLADGETLNAVVHDVSPSSVQIRCDAETARTLHPGRRAIEPGSEPLVDISLHLPFRAGALNLSARCLVVHRTACADERVAFGLAFKEFSRIGARLLEIFIQESRLGAEQ